MNESTAIQALAHEPVLVNLSSGQYKVEPLTVRRLSKLAVLLKDVQAKSFNSALSTESPEFHRMVADALVAAGEKMPEALGLLTGDTDLAKLQDISLLDLGAVVLAAAKANKSAGLKDVFRQAKDVFQGTPGPK